VTGRHAGIIVPLFSLRSEQGWGIGELPDIAIVARWMEQAALDRLMCLPLGTMPEGQTSPYAAVSTLAIDPLYVRVSDLPDFQAAGGSARLSVEASRAIDEARCAPAIRHDLVLRAKREALAVAFAHFLDNEWYTSTLRSDELREYVARQAWWLDDYALFLALRERHGQASWRDWPAPLANRDGQALGQVRQELADAILYYQWTQWVADEQWQQARKQARRHGVAIVGDLPFVAGSDSPEVWARPSEYLLDVSAGVPPDAFSATGQDWGLPTYNWPEIAAGGYHWQRQRGRRMRELFDGLRVDHVIGLFRTYGRPATGDPFFSPANEGDQIAQGRTILGILADSGLDLIAEDLGAVPEFLRDVLADLGVPGCKVMRWERAWSEPGAPFIDPASYHQRSAAMTGTHDTEPLAVWWRTCSDDDRRAWMRVLDTGEPPAELPGWSDDLRDRMLACAYRAGSADVFVLIQDVFGWPDRINVPGTVGPENWTWALPWPIERLADDPAALDRAAMLRNLARAHARGGQGTPSSGTD
jgi:4-alpha-glucanotransferase